MTSTDRLSKAAGPAPAAIFRGLFDEFANWYVLGPLSWVVLPSRCPPVGGIPRFAGRRVTVRFRGGGRAECRLEEFFSFVEVFVLREYDFPGAAWADARTIIDVGANVGAATLWFARRSPQAQIVAVEPAVEATRSLIRNLGLNDLKSRVHVVSAALSPRAGRVYLNRSGPSVYARTSLDPSNGSEEVAATSLRDLLAEFEFDELDVLKLDCEGAEFEVLLDCDDDIARRIRCIVGEYHGTAGDVTMLTRRLEELGFATSVAGDDALGLFSAVRR